jgi:hypothetical protein
MRIMASYGLILCSIGGDNSPAQVGGIDRALQLNNSPAIHAKCFADMANRVLATPVSTANFARIMDYLADLEQLLRSSQATAQHSPARNVRNLFERDRSIWLTWCA